MGSNNYYAPGQWNFYCDLCGKPGKSSEAVKTWDGFWVCRHHKEERNPQDFLRGVKDNQSVPWSRPQPVDTFVPAHYDRWLYDTVTLSEDFFIEGNATTRTPTDTVPLAESFISSLTKRFAESLVPTETVSLQITKPLSSAVTLTETVILGDVDSVVESCPVAETVGFAFTKNLSESLSISETVLFPVAAQTPIDNAAIDVVAIG